MQRILVVEDEFLLALRIQTLLEDADVEIVGPVGTLDEARKLADGNNCSSLSRRPDCRKSTAQESSISRCATSGVCRATWTSITCWRWSGPAQNESHKI